MSVGVPTVVRVRPVVDARPRGALTVLGRASGEAVKGAVPVNCLFGVVEVKGRYGWERCSCRGAPSSYFRVVLRGIGFGS